MAKKNIYVYKNASGEEICRLDITNEKTPIAFNKKFNMLRNAGYKIEEIEIKEKAVKKEKTTEEVK